MKHINILNKRIIIIITMLLIIIVGGTFAWFTYQSKKATLILSIGDINDSKVIIKPYEIREELIPSNTYTDGVYSQITAINNNEDNMNITLYYQINKIDELLINNGLKYTLVSSNSIDGEYTQIKTGDFKSINENNQLNILDNEINSNTTVYYRIYLWLDNNESTQTEIQNLVVNLELTGKINLV